MMLGETSVPLLLFAFVGAFTPGPNNLMATASGNAFGLARTIPQILGVTVGFGVMIVAFGVGLAQVVAAFPALHGILRVLGAAYLLYLAWRLARAGDPDAGEAMRRPLTFVEGALFQLINPKAWTLAVGVVAAFTTSGDALIRELATIVIIFAVMTLATLTVWCLFGVAIRTFLSSPRQRRIVNYLMATAVVLSVAMLFM
jgi:threonine/homoserine/homoserine lactone efflux protein